MLKILFCCLTTSQTESPKIDMIQPPKRVAYRPDSIVPFTEKDKQYFRDLSLNNNQE